MYMRHKCPRLDSCLPRGEATPEYKFKMLLAALKRLSKTRFGNSSGREIRRTAEDVLGLVFAIGLTGWKIPQRNEQAVADLLEESLLQIESCINEHSDSFPRYTVREAYIVRSAVQFLLDDYASFQTAGGQYLGVDLKNLEYQVDLPEWEGRMRRYWPPVDGHEFIWQIGDVPSVPESHWWWRL